jgi:hypothetical protein
MLDEAIHQYLTSIMVAVNPIRYSFIPNSQQNTGTTRQKQGNEEILPHIRKSANGM